MELAMNMNLCSLELPSFGGNVIQGPWHALSEQDLYCVDGGASGWAIFTGVCTVIAGAATVVGGVAALAVPEPTTLTKVGGWAAITAGVATIGAGIGTIAG